MSHEIAAHGGLVKILILHLALVIIIMIRITANFLTSINIVIIMTIMIAVIISIRSAATFSTGIITSATTFTMNFLVASDENELLGVHNDENELLDVRAYRASLTTLSDHVWKLKKKNINFNITWQVVKRVKPFAPSNKVCGICLQEKLSILRSAPSLNKRSEIFGHCIHRKKFLLSNLSMSTDEVSNAGRNSES